MDENTKDATMNDEADVKSDSQNDVTGETSTKEMDENTKDVTMNDEADVKSDSQIDVTGETSTKVCYMFLIHSN